MDLVLQADPLADQLLAGDDQRWTSVRRQGLHMDRLEEARVGEMRQAARIVYEHVARQRVAIAATGAVVMRDILAADAAPIAAIVLDGLMPGEESASLAFTKTLRIPVAMISGSIESIKFAEDNGLQLLRSLFAFTN